MSTRCNIIIKDVASRNKFILYHHYDGNPESVGSLLKEYTDYLNEKGYRVNYCDLANTLIKEGFTITDKDGKEYKDDEYKLTTAIHTDIEYLYHIDCNPYPEEGGEPEYKITCYAVQYKWDEELDEEVLEWKKEVAIPDYHNDDCRLKL